MKKYKNSDEYKFLRFIKRIFLFPFKFIIFSVTIFLKILLIWGLSNDKYKDALNFISASKYILKEFLQDIFVRGYKCIVSIKRLFLLIEMFYCGRETRKNYGNCNEDKTFFVIRPYYYSKPNLVISAIPHLLTNYYCTIQYIAYAKDNGWIPVVDWENYKLPHSEEESINGTNNAWEYYWKQPSEYTLDEVYRSKNVVLGRMNIPNGYLPHLRTPKTGIKEYAKNIILKGSELAKIVEFNEITKKYIYDAQNRLFPKNKKIMGVAIRGTSYAKINAGHHAAQPSVSEMIELIKYYYEIWEMDYIFFTNEEEETVELMKKEFGEKLIYLPRQRYRNYHIYSDNSPNPTNEDLNPLYVSGNRYKTNLDYITEMALLSKCDCLLSALSNGIKAVLLWGGKNFEHVEILDKGVYPELWERNKDKIL